MINPVSVFNNASESSSNRKAAQIYAEAGFKIFPAKPDNKSPYVKWKDQATTDIVQIKEWWEHWPDAMIGLPAGTNGLVVLDFDGKDHDSTNLQSSEQDFIASYGEIPDTLKVQTPSGGYHLYLTDDGSEHKSRNGIVSGVDVKSDGGYVIAPGSSRLDGKRYEVAIEHFLSPISGSLSQKLVSSGSKITSSEVPSTLTAISMGALVEQLKSAAKGARNHALNSYAFIAAKKHFDWSVDRESARELLLGAATENGMIADDGQAKFEATFQSGYDAGLRELQRLVPPSNGMEKSDTAISRSHGAPREFWNVDRPYQPFPLEALPNGIRELLEAIVDIVQCEPVVAFQSVLTTISQITQSHFDVQHNDQRIIPTSIYALTIAGQSERKSGADKMAGGFFTGHQQNLEHQYGNEYEIFDKEYKAFKAREKGILDAIKKAEKSGEGEEEGLRLQEQLNKLPKPVPPLKPTFKYADVTWEGLYRAIAFGQPAVMLQSDEAATLLGGYSFAADKALQTFGKLNKFWDGDPIDKFRAGGESYNGYQGIPLPDILHDKRLCMHLMMQPDVFDGFVHGDGKAGSNVAQGTGFLGRCFIVRPPTIADKIRPGEFSTPQNKTYLHASEILSEAMKVGVKLNPHTFNDLELGTIKSTKDIFDLIDSYAVEIDHNSALGNKYYDVRPFAGKCRDHILRLAANFQIADLLLNGKLSDVNNILCSQISLATPNVRLAITVFQWYLDEQLRIFSTRIPNNAERDAREVLEYVHAQKINEATKSQLKDRKQVFKGDRFNRAIDVLVENGWVTTTTQKRNGRNVTVYKFKLLDDAFDDAA